MKEFFKWTPYLVLIHLTNAKLRWHIQIYQCYPQIHGFCWCEKSYSYKNTKGYMKHILLLFIAKEKNGKCDTHFNESLLGRQVLCYQEQKVEIATRHYVKYSYSLGVPYWSLVWREVNPFIPISDCVGTTRRHKIRHQRKKRQVGGKWELRTCKFTDNIMQTSRRSPIEKVKHETLSSYTKEYVLPPTPKWTNWDNFPAFIWRIEDVLVYKYEKFDCAMQTLKKSSLKGKGINNVE